MNEQNGKNILERCDYLIINYLIYNIMKIKKSFGLLAAVAVVAAAGWNYQQCKQSEELSELALANVEALASSEASGRPDCEQANDMCAMVVCYPNGYGQDILMGHKKKAGWL